MAEAFTFFWKSRLSQWQRAPFVLGGVTFTHAEQYMMYAKALLFGDRDAAARILAAETPREQQAIGRTVRGFDESVWVLFREGVVFAGNYARFSQNPEQRELLLATRGTTLVEASPHDRVWGIGLAADDPRALDRSQWLGLNLLGEALTRVREALLWEQARAEQRPAKAGVMQSIGTVALLVRDYDEAVAFFTGCLRFTVVEDTPVGGGKRWVVVAPPGGGTGLLLARAATPEQAARVGDQTGGRVFLFLRTDDFWRDYEDMRSRGVRFVEEPREEPFGTVAIFLDLYGNRWDLVQHRPT